jgi:hypothetical protein
MTDQFRKAIKDELFLILVQDPGAKYRIRYIDYPETTWTVPVLLTEYRIESFANDASLEACEVRRSSGETITFETIKMS